MLQYYIALIPDEMLRFQIRGIVSDFAVTTAILVMVLIHAVVGIRTPTLAVPEEFRVSIELLTLLYFSRSSDVSSTSYTTYFTPCGPGISHSYYVFFHGCPCPILDVSTVLGHHNKITVIVSACISKVGLHRVTLNKCITSMSQALHSFSLYIILPMYIFFSIYFARFFNNYTHIFVFSTSVF